MVTINSMKRILLALLAGEVFLIIIPVIISRIPATDGIIINGTLLTVSLLFAAMVTGYISRQKGHFYGALLVLISYMLTVVVIAVTVFSNVVDAYSWNLPVSGDLTGLRQLIVNVAIMVIIPAMALGALGGYLGEVLYKKYHPVSRKKQPVWYNTLRFTKRAVSTRI